MSKSGFRSSPGNFQIEGRGAELAVGVNNREVELVFAGVEVDEEVIDLVEDFLRARVGAVDLVDYKDRRELRFERLIEHIACLRQGAFRGVDEQHHAIDHLECALNFAAEIGVARSIDDIDLGVAIDDGRVLGQNGNAAFALEFVRVHDPLSDRLVGAVGAGLLEHGVDERGLAMINVGDDGDIADGRTHGRGFPFVFKVKLRSAVLISWLELQAGTLG